MRPRSHVDLISQLGPSCRVESSRSDDIPFPHLIANVGFVRGLGLRIATQPPTDDPGHLWVCGKKTGSIKRRLARHATWVIPPESHVTG